VWSAEAFFKAALPAVVLPLRLAAPEDVSVVTAAVFGVPAPSVPFKAPPVVVVVPSVDVPVTPSVPPTVALPEIEAVAPDKLPVVDIGSVQATVEPLSVQAEGIRLPVALNLGMVFAVPPVICVLVMVGDDGVPPISPAMVGINRNPSPLIATSGPADVAHRTENPDSAPVHRVSLSSIPLN